VDLATGNLLVVRPVHPRKEAEMSARRFRSQSPFLFHVSMFLFIVIYNGVSNAEPTCAKYRAERCLFAPAVSASIASARCHPEVCAFNQSQVREGENGADGRMNNNTRPGLGLTVRHRLFGVFCAGLWLRLP
jgi:hypothetical protein